MAVPDLRAAMTKMLKYLVVVLVVVLARVMINGRSLA
jgi:hypothetical protein